MIQEAVALGLFLGLIAYEFVGLSPGGLIVPGYIALFLDQPGKLAGTLLASLVCLFSIRLLSNHMVLYGRRKFVLTVLLGFFLTRVLDKALVHIPGAGDEIHAIGYIVTGLIANEMDHQGIPRTLAFMVIIAALVRFILFLLKGWYFV